MPHELSADMLRKMLDAIDIAAFTFGRDRKILFANAAARAALRLEENNPSIGAGAEMHFTDNQYFDEAGNQLPYPEDSPLERAFRGVETRDLMIAHRNVAEHRFTWLNISCLPVMDEKNEFSYGILWYRNVTLRKSRYDKLRFLMESAKILSIATEFQDRLQEKSKLAVPSLADWCAIDILDSAGKLSRATIVHRDPAKIAWVQEFEKKYVTDLGIESAAERVVRTGVAEFVPSITDEAIDATPDMSDEQRQEVKTLGLSSIMLLPIGTSGNVLGVLTLAYAESGRMYTEDDLEFFKEFSYHLSVLLDNARLYEEIRQRDEAKDVFLAALSHELRNPLAPIKSAVEFLRIQNKDQDIEPEIDIIEHQFDHLARLLNDLLDTTRFVRGTINLVMEPVELGSIVRHVVAAIGPIVEKKGLAFRVHVPEHPLPLLSDRTRLEQAITNVVTNAVKFTPAGGEVSISVSHDHTSATISVMDTGAGITIDEMQHIFEPYYQGERVRPGNTGLGVGLRLVYEIVRLHGGTIVATSEGQGKGSEFTIKLPRMRP